MGAIKSFFGTIWSSVFYNPLLNVLLVLYGIFGDSFGWAIIVFAIIIRLLLTPAVRRQVDMTNKMTELKPRLEELQKKYKDKPQELGKAQIKLYKEVGYNPVGCLGTMLPQLFILFAMVAAIQNVTKGDFDGIYPFVKDFVFNNGGFKEFSTQFIFWDLGKNYMKIAKDNGYISPDGLSYFLLATVVGITQYISTKFIQEFQGNPLAKLSNKKRDPDAPLSPEEMQAQMNKSMNTIFPLLTMFLALSAPAALGIYWSVQSLMLVVQYFIIDKKKSIHALTQIYNPTKPEEELKKVEEDEKLPKKKKLKNKKRKKK